MWASRTNHTAPETVPTELLGGSWKKGLNVHHQMSRNQASGTFSGKASSNNPFFLGEQSAYLFLHTTKLNTQGTLALCWELPEAPRVTPLKEHCSKGLCSEARAPDSPGRPCFRRSVWCCGSLWPSRQGPSCPLDSLRLLGQPSSGISASQSCPG